MEPVRKMDGAGRVAKTDRAAEKVAQAVALEAKMDPAVERVVLVVAAQAAPVGLAEKEEQEVKMEVERAVPEAGAQVKVVLAGQVAEPVVLAAEPVVLAAKAGQREVQAAQRVVGQVVLAQVRKRSKLPVAVERVLAGRPVVQAAQVERAEHPKPAKVAD